MIYLRQNKTESIDDLLNSADIYIANLKVKYKIINVIVDNNNDRSQLDNFLNSPFMNFDIFVVDHNIADEFDLKIINELSRMENFRVEFLMRDYRYK